MTCGQKIKALRLQKQLSQKQLGDILHVSDKTISKWETGRSLPDIEMIQKIAQYFNISIDELINQRKGIKEKTKKLILLLIIISIILLIFILCTEKQNVYFFVNIVFIDLFTIIISIIVSLFVDIHHQIFKIIKYLCITMIIFENVLYIMVNFESGIGVFVEFNSFPIELILLSIITGFLFGADS
ncbi:MAG: helix-turn-helix domain-containing protein [Faecalibacillus sp.]